MYAYNVFWSSSLCISPFKSSQIHFPSSSNFMVLKIIYKVQLLSHICQWVWRHYPGYHRPHTLKENQLYLSQKLWAYRVGAPELLSSMLKGRLALPASSLLQAATAAGRSCMHQPWDAQKTRFSLALFHPWLSFYNISAPSFSMFWKPWKKGDSCRYLICWLSTVKICYSLHLDLIWVSTFIVLHCSNKPPRWHLRASHIYEYRNKNV